MKLLALKSELGIVSLWPTVLGHAGCSKMPTVIAARVVCEFSAFISIGMTSSHSHARRQVATLLDNGLC